MGLAICLSIRTTALMRDSHLDRHRWPLLIVKLNLGTMWMHWPVGRLRGEKTVSLSYFFIHLRGRRQTWEWERKIKNEKCETIRNINKNGMRQIIAPPLNRRVIIWKIRFYEETSYHPSNSTGLVAFCKGLSNCTCPFSKTCRMNE